MGTLHHNANPHVSHPMGLIYETPFCQRTNRSMGHDVGLSSDCDDEHLRPADVTEISIVRAITQKTDPLPTMSPYELGFWAGECSVPLTENPFAFGTNEALEWADGWVTA